MPAEQEEGRVVYHTTATITRAAAADEATPDELMALIMKHAPDPTVFTEDGVRPFAWMAEVSNSKLDTYFTRQDTTSLRNYAKDASAGVMFLDSHDKRQLGFGQSVRGTFEAASGGKLDEKSPNDDDPARVSVDFFTVPGVQLGRASSDSFIQAVRSGIIKDVSIGFMPDRFECNLCRADPFDWWNMECLHIPGAYYDSTGKSVVTKRSDGAILAFAWVRDSRLLEVSAVYDGATPEAYIKKAQWLVEAGEVDRAAAGILERQLRINLPAKAMMVPVLKVRDGKMFLDRGDEVIIDGVRYGEGMEIMPKTFRKLEQRSVRSDDQAEDLENGDVEDVTTVTPPSENQNLKREESPEGVADTSGGITSAAHAAPEDVRMNEEQIRQLEEAAKRDAGIVSLVRRALADAGVKDAETVDPAEAIRQMHAQITDLTPRAALGDTWRKRVVDTALDSGVRAEGDKFDRTGWAETFERMTVEQIERLGAAWERQAPDLSGGRKTADIAAGGDRKAKQNGFVAPTSQFAIPR